MIQLDEDSPLPRSYQIANRLRFEIATGRFVPGEVLPSTRVLGDQLGVSFHTVRKAYQSLESEGLVESVPGVGYSVLAAVPPNLEDRLERGAAIAQSAIQQMLALGLSSAEMEMLVNEQISASTERPADMKVIFAAEHRELWHSGSAQLSSATGLEVVGSSILDLVSHPDADLIVAPHPSLRAARAVLPQVDVIGVLMQPSESAVAEVSRLYPDQVLGLLTRHGDAVGPVLRELRQLAGFAGPALALETDADRSRLEELIDQVDLVAYTSAARTRIRRLVEGRSSVEVAFEIGPASVERVVAFVRS